MSTAGSARPAPAPIVAPELVAVIVTCPNCNQTATVAVDVRSRVVLDDNGTGTLGAKLKAPKLPHACGQLSLVLDE